MPTPRRIRGCGYWSLLRAEAVRVLTLWPRGWSATRPSSRSIGDVAAVWQTILSDDRDWLINRIRTFALTGRSRPRGAGGPPVLDSSTSLPDHLAQPHQPRWYLERRAGRIRNGDNRKGFGSRWYPETLATRIAAIGAIRDRITFVHGDGLHALCSACDDPSLVSFVDPPYTVAGKKAGERPTRIRLSTTRRLRPRHLRCAEISCSRTMTPPKLNFSHGDTSWLSRGLRW